MAPWIEVLWSIQWSFAFTMWPHDGGHWVRAQQIGGDFVISKFGYPFPKAEMRLPDQLPQKYQTLTSIGGHEINFLMRQQIHMDYYQNQYIFADELQFAFVQDIFFPFYALIIAHRNPTKETTWTDTWGDPVEYSLSVFKSYTGKEPVRPDGSVDPELIRQYRTNAWLSLTWPLLNPMFYRSLKSFGADLKQDHGLMASPWMLGNDRFAWSWGTHFNPSPLGYELHFINYFRYLGKLYAVSLKTGGPFKNNGAGIHIPQLFVAGKLQLGVVADIWDQDIFGRGGSVMLDARYQPIRGFGLIFRGSWKSDGYMVGRRVDQSTLFLAGGSYTF